MTNEEMAQLERSPFGTALFNIYTTLRGSGLLFSRRRVVVRAMLTAMRKAEAAEESKND